MEEAQPLAYGEAGVLPDWRAQAFSLLFPVGGAFGARGRQRWTKRLFYSQGCWQVRVCEYREKEAVTPDRSEQ